MTRSPASATAAVLDRGELEDELHRIRPLVRAGLEAAVARMGPDLERIVSYHLGWTDIDGHPVVADTGKLLRSCLAVLSAEAVGAPSARGVPGGVAVELVHNFSLLHDDVIDLDRERRHRPTTWTVFGIGPAIVAGDALLTLAFEVLLEAGGQAAANATSALVTATATMTAGQALDMANQVRTDVVGIDDVLDMFRCKTGALIGGAASIGAVLAGADGEVVEALQQFGSHLGIAFQAVDDLLGTFGDSTVTGKDVGGDVRRRKLTLPLAAALGKGGAPAEELAAIMRSDTDLDTWHVKRATQLMEACGGRELTLQYARENRDIALAALARATESGRLDAAAVRSLRAITEFALHRTY